MMDLIFCGGGNRKFYEIAINAGFLYGARLPSTIHGPLYFADQNWKKPNLPKYIEMIQKYRPYMATVLDLERIDQLAEVLSWAEEIAPFVEEIIIIPKVQRSIHLLPRSIAGKLIRLGYSVPTNHGGTALPYNDFASWPVHLLGGSPHKQMKITKYLHPVSTDGNMIIKQANKCRFWRQEKGIKGHWVNLSEVGDGNWGIDSMYEAFSRSCVNIIQAWRERG